MRWQHTCSRVGRDVARLDSEYDEAQSQLWIPADTITWRLDRANQCCEAAVLAEGASQDVGCEIRFQVREPWPDDSFSLLWRGTRVRGFDVTGPGPGESLLVSDGGYTLSQLGLYVRSVAAMRERQRDLERIAHELMLDWRGEFYATASDLEDALRRVSVISLAVDRALSLLRPCPSRVRPPLRAQFEKDLKHADIRM